MRAAHTYVYNKNGELLYEYTTEWTPDRYGNGAMYEQKTPTGEIILHVDMENHYSFGLLTDSDYRYTRYGLYDYDSESGDYYFRVFSAPTLIQQDIIYSYDR